MYGSFASNSPITDGQRVYASFGSRGVYAYDLDGKPVWQKDFGLQMRMFMAFGEGAGPVLDDGRLILLFDHEGDGIRSRCSTRPPAASCGARRAPRAPTGRRRSS